MPEKVDVAELMRMYREEPERFEEYERSCGVRETLDAPGTPRSDCCGRCGGAKGAVAYGSSRWCDCGKRLAAARRAIAEADPAGRMTFEALTLRESPGTPPGVRDAVQKLWRIASGRDSGEREAPGVLMLGLPGRGKTHLSIATARALLEREPPVPVGVYNMAALVSRIQATYGSGAPDAAESRSGIIAEVCRHDVVILDDVGKEHRSANVESIVYELVDGLYRAGIILIASSNLPGKDFVERYDGAVLSRLGGICEKLVIRGEDRRSLARGPQAKPEIAERVDSRD